MTIPAKLFARDGGKTMRLDRMTFHVEMAAEDTDRAYAVVEAIVPPYSGSGLDRHWSYDEAALVIDGRFEYHVDGAPTLLGAGESVYWPRGAVHKFRSLGPGDGRIVFISSPGRIFEDFIDRVASAPIDTGDANSGPAVDSWRRRAVRH